MPIQEGDVLFDRVENELVSLLDPNAGLGVDGNPDVHAQVMKGLEGDNADNGDSDTVDDDNDERGADDKTDKDGNDTTDSKDDDVDDQDKDDKKSKATKGKKTDTKPLYQDDPEYKAALEVKTTLDRVLKEYGLESIDDLQAELDAGTDIHEILGDLDLKEIIKSHKTLQYYESEWAKQEAAKKKENETPEETIKRLESEKQALLDKEAKDKEAEKERAHQKQLVKEFDDTVNLIIEAATDVDDDGKALVRHLMGIDNPNLDIQVTDKKAATKAAQKLLQMVKERDARIAQKAIDDYAKGKSKIVIKDKSKTAQASTATKAFKLPKNATPNQALAHANNQLIEILTQQAENEL